MVSYKNRVIRVRHAFKLDHSCEEIIAWNDKTNSPDYFTNGQGSEYLRVDANENTLLKWEKWQDERNKKAAINDKKWNDKVIKKGSRIKTFKGRTCPKGSTGVVYAMYRGYTEYNQVIYFHDDNGNKLKTYEDNLEIWEKKWVTPNHIEINSYKYICAGTY